MAFREYIFNNFWLKFFSLFAAILIWFWVASVQRERTVVPSSFTNFSRFQSVPVAVQVLTAPGDARVFKVVPDTVHVTITGEAAVLNELTKKEVKAYVDLTDLKLNENDERKVILHVPPEVTVREVSPSVVKVQQVSP